jgi:hypothetical protein
MTPVATLAAVMATTWDAALAETLSGAARRPSATAASATFDAPSSACAAGVVHSVHRRAANLHIGDLLVAVVSDELDDAAWTVRLSPADWASLAPVEGDPVFLAHGEIRIGSAPGIRLSPSIPRASTRAGSSRPTALSRSSTTPPRRRRSAAPAPRCSTQGSNGCGSR